MTLAHYSGMTIEETAQGFLTSHNEFVNRSKALIIAKEAKQLKPSERVHGKELYSENLY